ncbi:Dynein light chain 1, cytoplasmic [Cucurbita argyrosperma subsp. argyrosperma]|nr:Dynein light chain 1, cytoplasmic [Cucurbita argyrosperma subsp. argyrosperma]
MSNDAKRSIQGNLMVKSVSEDRKPLAVATTGKKIVIKSADMFGDVQKEAIDVAIAAFEKHSVEKDVAEYIKKEFDKRHGPTWHCIVGRNFGVFVFVFELATYSMKVTQPNGKVSLPGPGSSYVTHETNHFVYFYLDQKAVLLFKSG